MIEDVHTSHCCILHGCKYGDDDCTVLIEIAPQEYVCWYCVEEGITNLGILDDIRAGRVTTCKHCGHIQ